MFFFVTHMEEMFEDVLRVANRPMPILAAALFAGLGLGYLQSLLATLVLLVLFAGLAVRCIGTSETRKFWTLSAIGVAAGFLLAARDVTLREREARLFGENGVDGEFVCRVSEPVLERRVKNGGTRYSFKAESFAAVGGGLTIRRLPVQMTMTFDAGADGPQAGERWRFRGSARAEQAPKSPLPEVDVAVGMDGGARRIERATDNPTWLMRIEQWRRRAAERAVLGIEDWGTIPELNQAILLGVRGEMPLAMRRIFANFRDDPHLRHLGAAHHAHRVDFDSADFHCWRPDEILGAPARADAGLLYHCDRREAERGAGVCHGDSVFRGADVLAQAGQHLGSVRDGDSRARLAAVADF